MKRSVCASEGGMRAASLRVAIVVLWGMLMGSGCVCDSGGGHTVSSAASGAGSAAKRVIGSIAMQRVPAGAFTLGTKPDAGASNIPQAYLELESPRKVDFAREFYMSETEVTNRQFLAFVDATGYEGGEQGKRDFLAHFSDPDYVGFRGPDKPVVFVSWHDAVAFCQWLCDTDERVWRLPTEDEWEYACAYGGHEEHELDRTDQRQEFGWFKENAGGATHPVGQKKPGPNGIHDMLGNVWEWTSSLFDEDEISPAAARDMGKQIVRIRGGSFLNAADGCRCAARWAGWPPSKRSGAIGFRVVRDVKPSGLSNK